MARAVADIRERAQMTRARPDRVPPHDLQAEESLLGAMLLSRDAISAAVEVCRGDDFYRPAHAHIFDAVCSLYAQGEPADPVTVADELRRADLLEAAGGQGNLVALQANTPAIANAAQYGRIVQEHALLRRLIGVASEIAEMGYSLPDDVIGTLDKAEAMVFDVAERRVTDSLKPLRELLAASLDHLEALYNRGDSITGVPTGYLDLDEKLSGLQPSSLVIVGARPSMGKTAFALGVAAHAATEKRQPVLFFSLEMGHLELTQRLLCSEARVDSSRMRNGRLLQSDWPKVVGAMGKLGEAPLFIDDNPNLTVMEIRAKARRLKSREGIGLIVVDYLQLMSTRNGSPEYRQLEVSEVSRGLKILARELKVPVVALSQLSRALEGRADKRPMLADLRECLAGDTRVAVVGADTPVTISELANRGGEDTQVWSVDGDCNLVPAVMTRTWSSGTRPVFAVRLVSGHSIRATENHPFLTPDGWAPVGGLDVGTPVAVAGNGAANGAGAGASSGISWSAVESVVGAGEEEVFDARVPGTHSFVAGGLISHNSGAIEQDADVVMFIYRDEVYNPDSSDRGVAEVLIAKHRNGPTGLAKLSFISNYARFGDLAKM